ncbi:MarR family transcriptional regulator [Kitasatospora sp. NPDC096140]|uniref:MarR family winged helix-turn-helix transcriptional regulator n=1 Tax=Kitasatospora sp. NPDC096140 TaxID=3155425 RepID=UPI0033338E4F
MPRRPPEEPPAPPTCRPSARPTAETLEGPLGRLYRIATLWKARLEPVLKAHGLTAAGFGVLVTLHRAGPGHRLTTGQLAALDLVTCSGMTIRADKLEQQGLIVRERDDDDRRIIHLRLTRAGAELVDRLLAHYRAAEEQLMATLDADAHRILTELAVTLERALHPDAPTTDHPTRP